MLPRAQTLFLQVVISFRLGKFPVKRKKPEWPKNDDVALEDVIQSVDKARNS